MKCNIMIKAAAISSAGKVAGLVFNVAVVLAVVIAVG
jgi:hypothetical protein